MRSNRCVEALRVSLDPGEQGIPDIHEIFKLSRADLVELLMKSKRSAITL